METFIQAAREMLGIQLSGNQIAAFGIYEKELLDWNKRINLTAVREPESIRIKHFLDSLTCLMAMRECPPNRLIDIGTGAGFPGIPLKILMPQCSVSLVESVAKKGDFCRHIIHVLKLEGIEVYCARAEDLGHDPIHRQQYDWAVARAVARMPVLMEYLLPFTRIGGKALAQKGETALAETHGAEHAIQLLGGRLKKLVTVNLPGVAEERSLIVVDKIAATPDRFPRRVGVASKNPLHKGKQNE